MPKYIEREIVKVHSKVLKQLIERSDLSLAEFARRCGFSPSVMSSFLSNKIKPSAAMRRKLQNQLKKIYGAVEWDDIFYFEKDIRKKLKI